MSDDDFSYRSRARDEEPSEPPRGEVPPAGPPSAPQPSRGEQPPSDPAAGQTSGEEQPPGPPSAPGSAVGQGGYEPPPAAPVSAATAPEGPGPVPIGNEAPIPPPRPRDPNVDAIARAGLEADMDAWLREVAAQVDPRLDRVAPGWRGREQSGAARACVFGLMLGRLANDYPHTSGDLSQVAETHPSFATLPSGSRLATLREIAHDRARGAAWVAPLVGLDDPTPLRDILE